MGEIGKKASPFTAWVAGHLSWLIWTLKATPPRHAGLAGKAV